MLHRGIPIDSQERLLEPGQVLDKNYSGPVGDRVIVYGFTLETDQQSGHQGYDKDESDYENGETNKEINRDLS